MLGTGNAFLPHQRHHSFLIFDGKHIIESPRISGYHQGVEWRTIIGQAINTSSEQITRIGLKVYKVGNLQLYHGLQLFSGEDMILNESWYNSGEWEY